MAFWKADPEAWPMVAELLQQLDVPWPEKLVQEDLVWWADQIKMGKETRPSRGKLSARWGVSDKVARRLRRELSPDAKGPAKGQQRASKGPAIRNVERLGRQSFTIRLSKKGQQRASKGPAKGPTRVSSDPRAQSTDFSLWVSTHVSVVYDAYRELHPSKPPAPTDAERKRIRWAIQQVLKSHRLERTEEGIKQASAHVRRVLDWFHKAPSASWFQGVNPQKKKYLGLTSPILKKETFGDRLAESLAWESSGREVAAVDYTPEAERAWDMLLGLIAKGSIPERVHPKPGPNDAFFRALKRIKRSTIRRCPNDFELQRLRTRWISCYTEERLAVHTHTPERT